MNQKRVRIGPCIFILNSRNLVGIVDWILYFTLCLVSFGLTWSVFKQYLSKSSGFKVYESPITEHPTITFCFFKWRENGTAYNINFEYRKHFQVVMNYQKGRKYYLKIGANYHDQFQDRIELTLLQTAFYGTCYKISTTLSKQMVPGEYYDFTISFNKTFLAYEDIPPVKIFFTSENNAYGITANEWRDGKVFEMTMRPCTRKNIYLKPIKYIYSKTKSNCREETFYECFGEQLYADDYEGCSKKCLTCKC